MSLLHHCCVTINKLNTRIEEKDAYMAKRWVYLREAKLANNLETISTARSGG
jgi:hypothetical protein